MIFATGGQPDVFGKKTETDYSGLLRLHQCYIGIDLILEQVLAEQALGDSPFPSNHDQFSPTMSNRVQQIYNLGDVGENFRFRKEQRC